MVSAAVAAAFMPARPTRRLFTRTIVVLACALLATLIALAPLPWLLVGAAAAFGALLALIFPWLAWLGLAFSLPITSGLRIGPASITDLLLALSLALWFTSFASRCAYVVPRLPVWSVGLYVLVLYVSSLGALNLAEALTEMVKWAEFAALLLVVPQALPANAVPWLVAALLVAAALQGFYGLYQFIFRIGPDWFVIQGRFMRASGVFAQPNPFGAYLGLSLPVAASLALWSLAVLPGRRTLAGLGWTLFYSVAACAIFAGLIASWSRGAWLGALSGLTLVLALYDRRTAMLLSLGLLGLAVTALLGALNPAWIPQAIAGRIGDIPAYLGFVNVLALEVNDDNFAVVERVAHWAAALRMWDTSPWLGVGPGNYPSTYAAVALPRWSDPLGHAHNIYLNVLAETGLLGLGAFLLMWIFLVGWLSQQLRFVLPARSWPRALAVGVLGAIAHLAVHSFFDNLFVQGMYLHVAFWLAAVAASRLTLESQKLSSLTAPGADT